MYRKTPASVRAKERALTDWVCINKIKTRVSVAYYVKKRPGNRHLINRDRVPVAGPYFYVSLLFLLKRFASGGCPFLFGTSILVWLFFFEARSFSYL